MRIYINPEQPESEIIHTVVDLLQRDGVIIYPTDTIYGVGCSIASKKGIKKIYELKRREAAKPFSFVCSDLAMVGEYATLTQWQFKILRQYLPGPFTFIVDASSYAPRSVISSKKRATVGIRIPDHPVPCKLVKVLGCPIITTSVNISGELVYSNPEVMDERFGNTVDVILDAGILPKEASTVVDLTGDEPVIVRQGKGIFKS